jgi:carotenoid cleavage dioxygenase-like enzyme
MLHYRLTLTRENGPRKSERNECSSKLAQTSVPHRRNHVDRIEHSQDLRPNAHAEIAGGPNFAPDARGAEEDDMVLLSFVLDGRKGTSYILVLDPRYFYEAGKASMDTQFPFEFHGTHVHACPLGKETNR